MFFGFWIAFFQQPPPIQRRYSTPADDFLRRPAGLATAFGQSVFVGLVNVGMTFVAIWLIDRLGRKPLLCIGLTGMTASLLTISWAFHATQAAAGGAAAGPRPFAVDCHAAYVASFAISLGPVMW